jgi:hypothetical protein
MYSLTAWTTTSRRAGELNIILELEGGMKDVSWNWTGLGLTSGGWGGWQESEYGVGYSLTLTDVNGDFAYLNSKLWDNAKQNKNTGHPPLPWFPRRSNFKGTMILLAHPTLPRLEWELF